MLGPPRVTTEAALAFPPPESRPGGASNPDAAARPGCSPAPQAFVIFQMLERST